MNNEMNEKKAVTLEDLLMELVEDDTLMQWCVDNDFCAEASRAVRYDSDFIWESESWPAGEYIVSEKDRNAEKFPFSIAKDK